MGGPISQPMETSGSRDRHPGQLSTVPRHYWCATVGANRLRVCVCSALVAGMLALGVSAAGATTASAQPGSHPRPDSRSEIRSAQSRSPRKRHASVKSNNHRPASAVHHRHGRRSPSARGATASPLAGMKWYVNPYSSAAQQQAAWQHSDPADAAEVGKIASQPMAAWLPNSTPNVTDAVSARIAAATAKHAVAQLVAYNIPERDCGGYASGGAASPSAYESWINGFAAGIGSHKAVVVLEPDALAAMSCLSASDQAMRLYLVRYAVQALSKHVGAYVYIDAGHEGWQTPAVIAKRLQEADIAQAQGFSLNVDNFYANATEVAYGRSISALVAGKHFLLDTSRNGNGSNGQWCNPPGRALGARPTTATGTPLVDAFLWIKTPGVSDGSCNGAPFGWWPGYALQLAKNAAF